MSHRVLYEVLRVLNEVLFQANILEEMEIFLETVYENGIKMT